MLDTLALLVLAFGVFTALAWIVVLCAAAREFAPPPLSSAEYQALRQRAKAASEASLARLVRAQIGGE